MKQRPLQLIKKLIKEPRLYAAKLLPGRMLEAMLPVWEFYKKAKMPEERRSFGSLNPDLTFYVIRLYPPGGGYLSNYLFVLGYMRYAYEKGWVPVVDMKHYQTQYSDPEKKENVWEWFFEQPLANDSSDGKRYTLDEVYRSKNVILSNGTEAFHSNAMDSKETLRWQREMMKRVPFNKTMSEHMEQVFREIFPDRDHIRVIGVPVRGTDLKSRVKGHPIQVSAREAARIALEKADAWGMDSVFVNAEEEQDLDAFCATVPNARYTKTVRIRSYEGGSPAYANRTLTQFEALRDYLTNMYLISKCDALIGTMNNGFYTAYLWSDGHYENCLRIDKGTYA